MTAMGIAAGFTTAAWGIVRVGAAADVEFEFDVADCVMFLFDAAEVEEFRLVELVIEVLEFAAFGLDWFKTIERLEIKLANLAPNAFVRNSLTD